jgi:4-alpha-glucanotransferase
MSEALDRLAARVGIERDYIALTGETKDVSDDAKRATLRAMGIAAGDDDAIAAALATVAPVELGGMEAPKGAACFVPGWLKEGRCWGVACQLYGLRSQRNAGIGDFEDLARFAEIAAAEGADFVGVNPLHALFLAAPERCSPFYPSTRQFLNPLYIALDKVPGAERLADALDAPAELRASELVDYRRVAEFKTPALGYLFRIFQASDEDADADAFRRFVAEHGRPLYLHALYEALSQAMVQQGNGPGWHGWPEEYRHPGSDSVRAFAEEQADLVTFHCWLQWLADRQLSQAQGRARAAGMRIGLYLDLAVGVAPDGSATWSDPDLVVPGARIGAPPDYYNAAGQDWGLAPLSPAGLAARAFEPFRQAIDTVVRHAGALRIDHAMSLYRLFWIADGFGAADGVYVRYPFSRMLQTLAAVSQARHTIVIGEDLGVVPPGFREVMRRVEVQGYRVFFFERQHDFFLPPAAYPHEALACITTHDLYTLAGWWSGRDIEVRRGIGMIAEADVEREREERAHERRRVLGLLAGHGLLPDGMEAAMRGDAEPAAELPEAFAVALHRLVARTPSRMFCVPAEDLTGAVDQVNVPGTVDEHPNWRRKVDVDLERLPERPLYRAIVAALAEERPKDGGG